MSNLSGEKNANGMCDCKIPYSMGECVCREIAESKCVHCGNAATNTFKGLKLCYSCNAYMKKTYRLRRLN